MNVKACLTCADVSTREATVRVNHIYAIAASAVFAALLPKQQSSVDAVIDKAVATYNKDEDIEGHVRAGDHQSAHRVDREGER